MDGPSDRRLKDLFAYWESKRGGRAMPARSDIDPIEIPRLLPHLLLVEVHDGAKRFRFRLTGTWVDTIYGENLTGTWLEDYPETAVRNYWLEQYARTAASRQPTWGASEQSSLRRKYQRCEWIMLPLAGATPTGLMIMVGVAFS